MPYFAVDDQFSMHPKVIIAGNSAIGLWVRAGAWSKAHVTGGFIPTQIAAALGSAEDAAALVGVGLWDAVEGGYQFHDWEDTVGNYSAEEESQRREAARAANRARQKAWRDRQRNGVTNGVRNEAESRDRNAERNGGDPEAGDNSEADGWHSDQEPRDHADSGSRNAVSNAVNNTRVTAPPSPSPSPLTTTTNSRRLTSVDVSDDERKPIVDKSVDNPGGIDLDRVESVIRMVLPDASRPDVAVIAGDILLRQKRTGRSISDPTAYVIRSFRRDPFEWEKRWRTGDAESEHRRLGVPEGNDY